MIRLGVLLAAILTGTVCGQDDFNMEEKLNELSAQARGVGNSDAEIVADWTIEEGGIYVINGAAWQASMPSLTQITLTRYSPPPPDPPANRVINQFNRHPEVRALGDKLGIPSSTILGWGLVTNLNSGLCGGDGWEEQIGRENAMILARAGSSTTRWEWGLYGGDGLPNAEGGLWGTLMSWGWEDPAEFDGWLVFDVETWNMTLMARRERPQGTGYLYDMENDTVTLYRSYPKWRNANNLDEKLAVHPYGIDTNGDGVNDALRFTRDDVIREHIRIMAKVRKIFPKAKFGAYNFPNMGYWWDDETEARNQANWATALEELVKAGAVQALMPSVYDHYSHVFRFPGMTDQQWTNAQRHTRARDMERFSRGVRHTLDTAVKLRVPVYLYTWDVFHSDGRCSKSGWVISWGEWEDHIRTLASLKTDRGVGVDGIFLWGARRYYWDNNNCYRPNMETYIGTTDKEFEKYDLDRAFEIMRRASAISTEIWSNN